VRRTVTITTAERLIQPAVEEKQFRMGSARNSAAGFERWETRKNGKKAL